VTDQRPSSDERPPVEQPAAGPPEEAPESAWRRRRRLAEVFGDVLPETTRDERERDRAGRSNDEWLRDQVPPHHGG